MAANRGGGKRGHDGWGSGCVCYRPTGVGIQRQPWQVQGLSINYDIVRYTVKKEYI